VTVADGRITLDGIVHWEAQKMMAEATVKRLPGITGVYNRIEVQPQAPVAKLDEEADLIDTQTDTAISYENLGAVD
jgi:osmotically-inducible protein OsmY